MNLEEKHVRNCRVVPSREAFLEQLPRHAICAEIGVLHGDFSRQIFDVALPDELHLIDINTERFQERFRPEEKAGIARIHQGLSKDIMAQFPDRYFDWVYIDADHVYESVKADLEIARLKVKENGLICGHDYIQWDYVLHRKFGVIQAVNEFCLAYGWEMILYELSPHMFNSFALRRMS